MIWPLYLKQIFNNWLGFNAETYQSFKRNHLVCILYIVSYDNDEVANSNYLFAFDLYNYIEVIF